MDSESDRGSGYYAKTKEEGLFVKIKRQYLESEDDLYYQNCLTWKGLFSIRQYLESEDDLYYQNCSLGLLMVMQEQFSYVIKVT